MSCISIVQVGYCGDGFMWEVGETDPRSCPMADLHVRCVDNFGLYYQNGI